MPFMEKFETLVDLHDGFLEALVLYMDKNNMTVSDISAITTLSTKTIKRFLKNYKLRENSYRKLFKLGDGYSKNIEYSLMKVLAIMESKSKSRAMYLSLHPQGDYFMTKSLNVMKTIKRSDYNS